MEEYKLDTTAAAVVLNEFGNLYLDEENKYLFTTDMYKKVKIFNKELASENLTIDIDLYKKQKVKNIKACTYNIVNGSIVKTLLKPTEIYTKNIDDKFKRVSFTLPNIKDGSVIEYTYQYINPYSSIDDWYFQDNIPKVKSTLKSSIIGNYHYNRRISGYLKLDVNESNVKKKCIFIEGAGWGSCLNTEYSIYNIPAFKEESYMLSKKNYLSKISFDLVSYTSVRGEKSNYTTTWKQVDKRLKNNFLNKQSNKNGFFKKRLPEEILSKSDKLEIAIDIFDFIKNNVTWNGKFWQTSEIKVKKSFEEGVGAIEDVNLSLYNSLQAAGIESYIVLLSTRKNGTITKIYPNTDNFNYIIVKVLIDNKEYFLDASNKLHAFGQVPFYCLNGDARVLDFKNGGYWQPVKSTFKSLLAYTGQGEITPDGILTLRLKTHRTGYFALNFRKLLKDKGEESYIESMESENLDLEVTEYKFSNLTKLDTPVNSDITMEIDYLDINTSNKIRFNPMIFNRIEVNPFKLNERIYPVDFGYALTFSIFDNQLFINYL